MKLHGAAVGSVASSVDRTTMDRNDGVRISLAGSDSST